MKIVVPERVKRIATRKIMLAAQGHDFGYINVDGHFVTTPAKIELLEKVCDEAAQAALPAALQEWIASGEAQKTVGYVTSNGRWAVYALEDVDMDPGEFSAIIIKMEPDND